ncbi:hypothetical protein ACWUKX_24455 [Mesorhizobium sp. f-mel]
MYLTRDMSSQGKMQRPAAPKPITPVKLTSVRTLPKPVRVVRLYDPKKKAEDLHWIRKLERTGLTEHNSKAVALMKATFRRRYGERV